MPIPYEPNSANYINEFFFANTQKCENLYRTYLGPDEWVSDLWVSDQDDSRMILIELITLSEEI